MQGFEPVTYDNLSRGNRWAVKWGPLEEGDIADEERLASVLRTYRPAALMHFAAFAYVGESVEHPLLYYRNNVAGTATLLQTVLAYDRLPVVFSSTCATYGIPNEIPITEAHGQSPINPYGFSKLAVERMLADLERSHGLRSMSFRYFNAAGADPDGEIGEAHDPEPHLIPNVLRAARDGTAVNVYGNDYATPDGTCIRDYIHVSDLAEAHVLGLRSLLAEKPGGAFNLANLRGYSVLEVIDAAKRVTGRHIEVKIAERRPGDPPVLIGSFEAAKAALGWMPVHSEIDRQIEDAWRWEQNPMRDAQ